ncbi:23S rRNA (cytosine(1962)-C(5))-methyltransferase RlmI, partial [bacterium]|nr:23S rRNA (cytosine(1962)-C(5))-methyltransferase RlmI [bacterium]
MATIHLKPGSEKPLLRRHPWIYSGAIRRVEGNPASGETVGVRAADGLFLARGAWSPQSQIRVRVWTFDENEPVDAKFFRERLRRAVDTHRALLSGEPQHTACRLVNAETDGLPGLIVD